MTEAEFKSEIRRGLITIMRALISYYGMAWLDFIPREENRLVAALASNHLATSVPVASEHNRA